MSSFGERLKEAYGTQEIAKLAEKLGVTYQAAKNYVEGRIPPAEKLIEISDSTNCSIHWLLTNQGDKFVSQKNDISQSVDTGDGEFNFSEILNRLTEFAKQLVAENKIKKDSLILSVVKSPTNRKWFSQSRPMVLSVLSAVHHDTNINLHYLLTGEGEKFLQKRQDNSLEFLRNLVRDVVREENDEKANTSNKTPSFTINLDRKEKEDKAA